MVEFENVPTFLWWKKSLNVSNVKLLSNFFSTVYGFFDVFLFSSFNQKSPSIHLIIIFYFLLLETAPKFKIFQNLLRNKRCLRNGPEMVCKINSIKTCRPVANEGPDMEYLGIIWQKVIICHSTYFLPA